ncbi:tRNA 5-methylaminomethyl-2-thiouridine biosynthesis bifunctional protein MnmC, partial [Clarias magur]
MSSPESFRASQLACSAKVRSGRSQHDVALPLARAPHWISPQPRDASHARTHAATNAPTSSANRRIFRVLTGEAA